MTKCLFVSDLHGNIDRYKKLLETIDQERPAAVFLGGDLTPSRFASTILDGKPIDNFINDFMIPGFSQLKEELNVTYPRIFLILGNDDTRTEESHIIDGEAMDIWEYIHEKRMTFKQYSIYGYAYVPPTPFMLKDWERYDVSRYVDPGCIPPEEGWRSVNIPDNVVKNKTIQKDLEQLVQDEDLSQAIFLFHTPPYHTNLDRAGLDGKTVAHTPVDVHVGSIAVKRFIDSKQPLITLHGHIHESARLTGSWQEQIGNTYAFSAAHHGPELALVRFDPEAPQNATRELL
jgi:Icc-related predicted phosphoesterase